MDTFQVNSAYDRFTLRLTVNETSTSVENNTSTLNFWLDLISNSAYDFAQYAIGRTVTLDGNLVYNQPRSTSPGMTLPEYGTLNLGSGSTTITHSADGSKIISVAYSIDMASVSYTPGPMSGSGNMTLTTIPRASSVSCLESIMGNQATIGITRASGTFTHTLTYSFKGAIGTIVTKTPQTSVPWTPPIDLANRITEAEFDSCTITCETFNGDNSLGTKSVTFKLSVPASAKPVVNLGWVTFSPYSDNSVVNEWGIYVKGQSRAQATFDSSKVTLAYGSPIQSYRITYGGADVVAAPYRTSILSEYGTINIVCAVKDKRGRESDSVTIPIIVVNYTAPAMMDIALYRCDANGIEADSEHGLSIFARATASIKDCEGHNTYTLKARFRKISGAYDYANDIILTSGLGSKMGGDLLSVAETYEAQIEIADLVSPQITHTKVISTVSAALNFRPGGSGARFGGYAEAENLLKVDWDMDVSGRTKTQALELGPASADGHGGYIDFHYNGDSGDNTGRIIQPWPGYIDVQSELQVYGVTQPRLVMNDEIYYGAGGYAWFKLFTFKPSSTWDGAVVRVRGYSETANLDGRGHWEIILSGAANSADVGLHNRGDLLFSTSVTPLSQFSYRFDSNSLYRFYFNAPQYTVYRILAEIFGPYEYFTAHHQVQETPSGTSINILGPY